MTAETPKRLRHLSLDAHVADTSGEFDQLVANLDALYALTDECMSFCPMASGAQPVFRGQDVKYNDFSGMFIEFLQSKLVPFELGAVNRATWRHTTEPGIKFNTYFEEVCTCNSMIMRNMILTNGCVFV